MTSGEKVTQARVGAFLLVGIILICSMVVYFGRFGDALRDYYSIRVEYPNASGLFTGADVLLAGAKVGSVESGPFVLDSMRGVYVNLKLYEGVGIPEGSTFTIGSSGLLGDSFVDITMPEKLDAESFKAIPPGAVITGKRDTGLGDLASGGSALLEDVRSAVANINTVVTRVNKEVLTAESVASINETLKNLEKTSAEFAVASGKIETVLDEASQAVKNASQSVEKVSVTIDKSTETLESAKKAAESFEKTMTGIRGLIAEAREGRGPVGTLLTDRTMADNLRALVWNLRRYGILWYKDRADRDQERGDRE